MSRWSANHYDDHRSSPPPEVTDIIRDAAACRSPRVLDVGCGTGLSTRIWAGRCDLTVGLDPDPEMLDVARQRSTGGPMHFVEGSGEQLPFRDRSFDVACFASAIHWLRPDVCAEQMARVLAANAVVAVVGAGIPTAEGFRDSQVLIRRAQSDLLAAEADSRPQMWSWDQHFEALARQGFGTPQIRILTSRMRWKVSDAVQYLTTTGAARHDRTVLPTLGQELSAALGEGSTDWSWDWRVATLRLNT